ncbi:glycosyltransferase [Magnetofaba australis]|uniref:Spore protein YkvP/CgeB glycosyl transferase-like domain-containing protein n=1 Tax=Magnetofaba australis IT-1 TaxID=1434232 RepID=A0A1Y2K2K5_9PROT|nr:glycosyltransferase [Magnetofaba australis]OSM01887.1 hypothetical protein MAIT1_01943 [Magnetofaba australis IT-1]
MKRCLFLQRRDRNYYPDIEAALRENGVEPIARIIETDADYHRTLGERDAIGADFLFTHPCLSPALTLLAREWDLPAIQWEVDKNLNPAFLRQVQYGPNDIILTTYTEDIAKFRAVGARCHYVLNAANVRPDGYPQAQAEPQYGVSFIGSVEAGENNYYRRTLEGIAAQRDAMNDQLRRLFEILQQQFQRVLDQQHALTLQGRYDAPAILHDVMAHTDGLLQIFNMDPDSALMLLNKEIAYLQREQMLKSLPQLDAFGPEDWGDLDWPNVRYHGPAPQYERSGEIFAASRINLSLARIYARDGLSDRIFNVLYAGGFLLADRQPPLLEAFAEGTHFIGYDSAEEMVEKAAWYSAHDAQRRRIAQAGRAEVHRAHTFSARIKQILELTGV